MNSNSILQLKHVVWGSAGLVVVVLLLSVTHLRAKPTTQAAPPVVEGQRVAHALSRWQVELS
jgi:hypothetical protein